MQDDLAVDISEEIQRLTKKSQALTKEIYAKLSPWQVAQVARHPQRPYTLDYVGTLFTGFEELHGDRMFADDASIVGGLARFDGVPCMVLGHQKGRDTKEKIARNFGMPKPEGYRKALRLMLMAEKCGLPVFTFVDTPGDYPGIDAEERGQSEASAATFCHGACARRSSSPSSARGGRAARSPSRSATSPHAAVRDLSVISPEAAPRSCGRAPTRRRAAETLGITANRLKALGLVDKVVPEPLGGAHRDPQAAAQALRKALAESLRQLREKTTKELVEERLERLMSYGKFKEAAER